MGGDEGDEGDEDWGDWDEYKNYIDNKDKYERKFFSDYTDYGKYKCDMADDNYDSDQDNWEKCENKINDNVKPTFCKFIDDEAKEVAEGDETEDIDEGDLY